MGELRVHFSMGVLVLITPFVSYHLIATLMVLWGLFTLFVVLVVGSRHCVRVYARFFMFIAWIGMVSSFVLVRWYVWV